MKTILYTILWLTGSLALTAQPNKERIEAMKVSFITRELDLTAEEAQVFWPVYNRMQAEMETVHSERRTLHQRAQHLDTMSDREVETLVERALQLDEQELDIRRKYTTELKKVISIRKIARLQAAEKEFRSMLLDELRRRQGDGPGFRQGPPGR